VLTPWLTDFETRAGGRSARRRARINDHSGVHRGGSVGRRPLVPTNARGDRLTKRYGPAIASRCWRGRSGPSGYFRPERHPPRCAVARLPGLRRTPDPANLTPTREPPPWAPGTAGRYKPVARTPDREAGQISLTCHSLSAGPRLRGPGCPAPTVRGRRYRAQSPQPHRSLRAGRLLVFDAETAGPRSSGRARRAWLPTVDRPDTGPRRGASWTSIPSADGRSRLEADGRR